MHLSPLRARIAVLAFVGAGAALAAACSSSSTEEVLAADAGPADTGSVDSGSDSSMGDGGGGSDSGVTVLEAGPTYDAGQPVILDAGPGFEGGIACVQGGVLEVEPNESPAAATSFSGSICGILNAGPTNGVADGGSDAATDAGDAGGDGGSGLDEDYVTFTLKPTTSNFHFDFNGDIVIDIALDGSVVATLEAGKTVSVPFAKDKPYVAHIKPAHGRPAAWRFTVFEN